jgi:prefoldin subunit 5
MKTSGARPGVQELRERKQTLVKELRAVGRAIAAVSQEVEQMEHQLERLTKAQKKAA